MTINSIRKDASLINDVQLVGNEIFRSCGNEGVGISEERDTHVHLHTIAPV